MEDQKPFRILLYYKYVAIDDYEAFAAEHLEFCKELGVKGRIIIAAEGINGTISGTWEQTEAYMTYMHKLPLFTDLLFKIDESEKHAFTKLFVRPKKELVTLRYDTPLDPNTMSGKRLSPKEFYEQLQREDIIILDGRNGYEYDMGHFRNAIRPDIESFREFPEWIRNNLSDAKDKKVITYCTGGIRCETLTGVLLNEGFTDVAQLDGGIVTYGKDPDVQGRLFDGKLYVFDERIGVRVNQTDEEVTIAKCQHCGNPTDNMINCTDDLCHSKHFCCEDCLDVHEGYCSDSCKPKA
ncbi:rhodanese-related sulfurtransferase [Paenibacillus sp. PR3]|uniref:tRNA uridine(34) hydroxylase n=1 Tax=Paenibacillus terricola TaxID=2763503 RepID=A0ABR8MT05_9BACL|nr:rhodanese-related sulfurtransferase [Paenibacillus terricola]MBD3919053.1 rhodanese-related sulfurtransferase [Paenibacillus terricola]